ncbi:MAG: hypothetical protein A2Y33_09575 [Spirochaetes bacterium GWF1_51_8]|nr:MAG: hypothetical protein A2Y33_09575 [Spirochaetes bacterium GWF1_51_8]
MSNSVLIVDDSVSMRFVVKTTLQNSGLTIVEAVNGIDGLEKLQSHPVQIVISDLHMPEMDGFEFIRKVREMPDYKFIPIIVLTTEANPVLQQEAKKAGASAWVIKPFTSEKLIEVIKKLSPGMVVK